MARTKSSIENHSGHILCPQVVLFGVVVVACSFGCNSRYFQGPPDGELAVYDDMSFLFGPGESSRVIEVSTDSLGPGSSIASVYVELRDGRKVFLPDMGADIADALTEETVLSSNASGPVQEYGILPTQFSQSKGHFEYQNGRLIRARLVAGDSSVVTALGLTKDGPYIPLGMNRKELVNLLGEPSEWQPYVIARAP